MAYDNYVREMHWPKVSDKKKKELEMLKDSIKKVGDKGMKEVKSYNDLQSTKNGKTISDNEGERTAPVRRKIIWKDNTMNPKKEEKKEPVIRDYLKEMRIANRDRSGSSGSLPGLNNRDWKKEYDKMELKGKEKFDVYFSKAKDFEEKAARKQQIIGVSQSATIEDII
jgi:hypothetical protein